MKLLSIATALGCAIVPASAQTFTSSAGNLRVDVLQQEGRLNHLPLIEAWRDLPAQNAHAAADHTLPLLMA